MMSHLNQISSQTSQLIKYTAELEPKVPDYKPKLLMLDIYFY